MWWYRDRANPPSGSEPLIGVHHVSPDYFQTLRVPPEKLAFTKNGIKLRVFSPLLYKLNYLAVNAAGRRNRRLASSLGSGREMAGTRDRERRPERALLNRQQAHTSS